MWRLLLAGGAFDSSVDMRRLAWDLENEDIAVVLALGVTDVSAERISVRPVGGMPLDPPGEAPARPRPSAAPSAPSTSSAR